MSLTNSKLKIQILSLCVILFSADVRLAIAAAEPVLSVNNSYKKLSKIEADRIPEWPAGTNIQSIFKEIRDHKILPDPYDRGTLRRIPWMYPDDGCMIRAAIWIHDFARLHPELPTPAKLYVSGNLKVSNEFTPVDVEYTYHVAPAVRIAGDIVVFDPSMDLRAPLTLTNWALKMLPSEKWGRYAVCDSSSFNTKSPCIGNPTGDREAELVVGEFLRLESERVRELNLNPRVLSDEHPWD